MYLRQKATASFARRVHTNRHVHYLPITIMVSLTHIKRLASSFPLRHQIRKYHPGLNISGIVLAVFLWLNPVRIVVDLDIKMIQHTQDKLNVRIAYLLLIDGNALNACH